MENANKPFLMLQGVLAHCSHQAKQVKKLTRSANAFAKQTKIQSDKVQVLTHEAASSISSDLSKCLDTQNHAGSTESIVEIQSKLKELLSFFPEEMVSEPHTKSQCSTSETETTDIYNELRLPVLPTSCDGSYDDAQHYDVSDCESDFFPDWSSVESCTSSIGSRNDHFLSKYNRKDKDEIFLTDDDFLKLSDDDFDFSADDDDEDYDIIKLRESKAMQEGFDKGECSLVSIQLPVPACGNDVPGPSSDISEKASLPLDNTVMKPQDLRRVKSMIVENDLEDGVDVGKRMFVLQQKRNNISMTSHPSPLLTTDDVTSLRKSPSQLSPKFTLKRSRSNISTELSSRGRDESSIVEDTRNNLILEENESNHSDETHAS